MPSLFFICIMIFVYGQMCQIYRLHSCAHFLAFQIKLVNIILTKYKYNSIVIVSMLSADIHISLQALLELCLTKPLRRLQGFV